MTLPKRLVRTKPPKTFRMRPVTSFGMRWDDQGRAYQRTDDGPETRSPEFDFGTEAGDLLVDPWIQDILRTERSL